MEAPHARILHKELEIVAYEEGVAGAGEGVHGHAPAAELNSLVVQLPGSAVFRGLKVDKKKIGIIASYSSFLNFFCTK